MDYQAILREVYDNTMPFSQQGKQATYILALANVNPDQFGIYLSTLDGQDYSLGDFNTRFSIQSISKVFSLAIALSLLGKDLWQRIGKEPSGSAFNSLVQLEYEKGRPRTRSLTRGTLPWA